MVLGNFSEIFASETSDSGNSQRTVGDKLAADEVYVDELSLRAIENAPEEAPEDIVRDSETATLIITDRRLFLSAGRETGGGIAEIQFPDVRGVDVTDTVFSNELGIRLWEGGTYRFSVARGESLTEVVEYLQEAHTIWKRVGSVLTNAQKASSELESAVEAGDMRAAFEAREKASAKIEKAKGIVDGAAVETAGIERQIERVQQQRKHSEMRARMTLAEQLAARGNECLQTREYERAHRHFWKARDHLENAVAISKETESTAPPAIEDDLNTVEQRLVLLHIRPLALAKQSQQRARSTTNPETAVRFWYEAFEHYRDALEAGWGTELDFRGETESIREQLIRVNRNRIDAHRWYANSLESEATEYLERGEYSKAIRKYGAARNECDAALEIAREFRAGDSAAIREQRHRLNAEYEAVRWELARNEEGSFAPS